MSDFTPIEYAFEPEASSGADNVANRIDVSGKYIGKFLAASAVKSAKGNEGIELTFVANDGGLSDFTLWTRNAAGEQIFGYKMLQALLVCIGVKGLRSVEGKVERYDAEVGQRVAADGHVFPDLCGKPIGALLQKEVYDDPKFRMNLYLVFEAATGRTATEIRENKPAAKVERALRSLKDKVKKPLADSFAPPPAALGEGF